MATTFDPDDRAVVNYDEPPIKPPPDAGGRSAGVDARKPVQIDLRHDPDHRQRASCWSRRSSACSSGRSARRTGSSITNNLRLFMAARSRSSRCGGSEWAARLCAFVVGFTLLAYTRVSRTLVVLIVVAAGAAVRRPRAGASDCAARDSYLAAGSTPIVSGTVTETPQDELGFHRPRRRNRDRSLRRHQRRRHAGRDCRVSPTAPAPRWSTRRRTVWRRRQERLDLQNRLDHGLLTDAQRADLTSTGQQHDRTAAGHRNLPAQSTRRSTSRFIEVATGKPVSFARPALL